MSIVSIDASKDRESAVSVTIEVESVPSRIQLNRDRRTEFSGAYDVHLFRDGQLVRRWPKTFEKDSDLSKSSSEAQLTAWRQLHNIHLVNGRPQVSADVTVRFSHGKYEIAFHDVAVPRAEGSAPVFTAYAFNSDRVRSVTSSPVVYRSNKSDAQANVTRRAYVVTMGVNANESHFDLEVAVSSAERARAIFVKRLQATYNNVVEIPLYSDLAPDSPAVKSSAAKKIDLETVFNVLSGRPYDSHVRDEIDPQHQLHIATPDDAVVLYVASHGYTNIDGTFFLIPFDTGPAWGMTENLLTRCEIEPLQQSAQCRQAREFLRHSISSSDLASWWTDVDAGELDMVLDSCHSGAAPGRQFRAGPLGDPGLGQLAFDKKIRILAASQPAQTEQGLWIDGGEGRTLLVEAMDNTQDSDPPLSMREWFGQIALQLPIGFHKRYPKLTEDEMQWPKLLDFSPVPEPAAPFLAQ